MNKVRLGNVCDILNGYAFRSENYVDEGIRVIRIANVQKGYIEDKEPQYYPFDSEEDISKYYLQENDLLISLTGNVGRVALLPKEMLPAALNQRVACLRMKDDSCISKDYLYHLLNTDYFEDQCIRSAKGVAQKNMSTKWLMQYEIPVFDNVTQTHLISTFDIIDQLVFNYQSVLTKMDELIKSRFVEMFGDLVRNPFEWDIQHFSELTELITDGEHATPNRTESGIYLLSARNVLNHSLQLDDVDYISEDEYRRISKRITPRGGDVLLSCSGSVGRCCVVPKGIRFQMVRSVAILRFKKNINPVFAEYLITSDYVQDQINSSKTISSQANLFQGKIAKLKGFTPPIELQNQFADFVTQVEKQKATVQQSIDKLETLKKSLMQEYFGV